MSQLWTDIIDPAALTGYARESLAEYEARKGTLARWLPNREVPDVVVRFMKGQTGLHEVAQFRAYDAPPEIGRREGPKRVTLELPALGQDIPVSEYEQLRARGVSPTDAQALTSILNTTRVVVRAVSDAVERMRGIVLMTGRATILQDNFQSDDDFGRPAAHTVTASSLWSSPSVDRLDFLEEISDVYEASTGETPGAMVFGRRVMRSLAAGEQFQTQLLNGGARNATQQQVEDTLSAAGLPPMFPYDRKVSVGGTTTRVLDDDKILLLPAPVDPNDEEGSELGSTFWGRTLTSTDGAWEIEADEQPGIVAGVYRNPKPPMGIEVISDAIGLPVLANAELSLAAKVL